MEDALGTGDTRDRKTGRHNTKVIIDLFIYYNDNDCVAAMVVVCVPNNQTASV